MGLFLRFYGGSWWILNWIHGLIWNARHGIVLLSCWEFYSHLSYTSTIKSLVASRLQNRIMLPLSNNLLASPCKPAMQSKAMQSNVTRLSWKKYALSQWESREVDLLCVSWVSCSLPCVPSSLRFTCLFLRKKMWFVCPLETAVVMLLVVRFLS